MTKKHRKLRIVLWIAGSVVVVALLGLMSLTVIARQAVNDYRSEAANQLNSVINGGTTGLPVELRGVLLGDMLNSSYKQIKSLDGDYKKLLTDVKGYVTVLDTHNVLVEQYNAGVKGEKPLGGELLKSVNRYKAAVENRFPEEKDRAKALSDLSAKITSTTDFDAVSADIDTVLQSGDKFLAEFREQLNTRITEFQDKVN